jgi:hypothetical protein
MWSNDNSIGLFTRVTDPVILTFQTTLNERTMPLILLRLTAWSIGFAFDDLQENRRTSRVGIRTQSDLI